VVGVQVGEDHQVDRVRGESGGGQALQVVGVQVVPGGVGPFLAVADAGVDQDAQAAEGEREAVAGDVQGSLVVGEVGVQPVLCGDEVRGGAGQQPQSGGGRQEGLVDAVDGDIPHGPGGGGGRVAGRLCAHDQSVLWGCARVDPRHGIRRWPGTFV
jgi:hypothetical protein